MLEAESTPGPQCSWEDYVNEKPSGIEPVTFQFVAQCLDQLCCGFYQTNICKTTHHICIVLNFQSIVFLWYKIGFQQPKHTPLTTLL
jgi:hypothetical protein